MAGVEHVVDVTPRGTALSGGFLSHLAITENCCKNVVEIVGDAPRERAHCFHLLRLTQLRFELVLLDLGALALGNVLDCDYDHCRQIFRRVDPNHAGVRPDGVAILVYIALLHPNRFPPPSQQLRVVCLGCLDVVRMDDIQGGHRPQLVGRIADDPLIRRVRGQSAAA